RAQNTRSHGDAPACRGPHQSRSLRERSQSQARCSHTAPAATHRLSQAGLGAAHSLRTNHDSPARSRAVDGMKRFDFPLERVRRWRAEQASLEELKLQQLRAEMASLQTAQRQFETEIVQSAQNLLEQPSFDPIELSTLDSYRL